ncbi:PspA-associated protein PspAA [Yinghuangia sp. YIM S09857]|uniref:PspA-associated protein PspAA n=1 Tax=Yinghuangia sp. YIM S09857 TaxID=3436929 RepID=UPI003F533429
MIVRIMGEGQLDVADEHIAALDLLDNAIESAVEADDETAFRAALVALLERVREVGAPVPADVLEPSQLILPAADAHVDDVRELFKEGGLIPG